MNEFDVGQLVVSFSDPFILNLGVIKEIITGVRCYRYKIDFCIGGEGVFTEQVTAVFVRNFKNATGNN